MPSASGLPQLVPVCNLYHVWPQLTSTQQPAHQLDLPCSTYGRQYAPFTERPAVFTKDGIPLSATRVPGKPLMVRGLLAAGCR